MTMRRLFWLEITTKLEKFAGLFTVCAAAAAFADVSWNILEVELKHVKFRGEICVKGFCNVTSIFFVKAT